MPHAGESSKMNWRSARKGAVIKPPAIPRRQTAANTLQNTEKKITARRAPNYKAGDHCRLFPPNGEMYPYQSNA